MRSDTKKEPIVDAGKSSILNKILVVFFVVILLVGISINYFLQKYLYSSLNDIGIVQEQANQIMSSFIKTGTGVTLLFAIISILISFIIARSIIKPIVSLKKATDEMSKGNWDYKLSIDSDDEIGELAAAFKKMAGEIKEYHDKAKHHSENLEQEVVKKTNELQSVLNNLKDDKGELEKQRMAILNILEDISESKETLENLNDDLANKSKELESLKSFSDELTGVLDIEAILRVLDKYFDQLCDFSTISYLIYNQYESKKIIYRINVREAVGSEFVKAVQDNLSDFINREIKINKSAFLQNALKAKPILVGMKTEKTKEKPRSVYAVPLTIAGNVVGVIQLASKVEGIYRTEESRKIIEAIVSTASVSIDRFQSLVKYQNLRTEALVESLSDGVIMFNREKEVVLVNPAATQITGISKDSEGMSGVYELFKGINMKDNVVKVLEKGDTVIMNEVSLGRFVYEIYMTPIHGHDDKIIAGALIIHDITHIKEVDQMKTEFVSVASHQLRTPLTAIKLFTEMLMRGDVGKLKKDQLEYLENVYQSTERMVRLVNDLLSLSRLESGRLKVDSKPTRIDMLMDSIVKEIRPVATSRGTKIDFIKPKRVLPKVKVDENLFRQVLHNLVTNAVRYSSPEKGEVEVKLEKIKGFYRFSVKDNGIGIPEEAKSRIFEKFYRADNARIAETEGSGLGLYVSKMIVESSKGKIWFESKANKGTTFFVDLPVTGMLKKKGEKTLPTADNKQRFS